MSNANLVKRGIATLGEGDESPFEITLDAPIRVNTAILVPGLVRERRKKISKQSGTVTISSGGTSPNDVTITAVDLASAELKFSFAENRDGNARGVIGKLNTSTQIRFEFYGTVDATENIKINWEVIEHRRHAGAAIRIVDETHLEVLFGGGPLEADEEIEIPWNLVDYDDVMNALLELDFKALRQLGYSGENMIVDKVGREFGNQKTYRIRLFDSKESAEAATTDFDGDEFEAGEIARVSRDVDIDVKNNDRDSMIRLLDKLADTPGIEEEE